MKIDNRLVKCPHCKEIGVSKPTGLSRFTFPPHHEFKCEKCGKTFFVVEPDSTKEEARIDQSGYIFDNPDEYRLYDIEEAMEYFENGGPSLVPFELWVLALHYIKECIPRKLAKEIFEYLGEDYDSFVEMEKAHAEVLNDKTKD